jgi:hypothetical protein
MNVVIKNEEGKYLSRVRGEIAFVDRRSRAFVYDYEQDKVEEQIRIVSERHGYHWTWEDVGDAEGMLRLPKTPYVSATDSEDA